ncbi:MAG TPA: sugar O-acetyltransferase [Acidobacteriaceae bacterium]|nr:sugar O-acetyltransferase [Acidobacteriaceae bacterium]
MKSELQKMLAGELYNALDPKLVSRRNRARDLCRQLQTSPASDPSVRRELLLKLFATGGDTVSLEPPFFCDYGSNIALGEHVFFNFNCTILDVCKVTIGDYSQFGSGVQILTPLHPLNAALRRKQEYGAPVTIGSDVWLGSGVIILPGVSIGCRTVVGAGSVVTRSLPDDALAVGNPCRVIRKIE